MSTQIAEQHIAVVNAAALKVQQECGWVNTLDRATVTVGAEQTTINYPPGCNPGSLRAVAVYDSYKYFMLESRIIPVNADSDQELAAGQPTLKSVCGRPKFYQQRHQIELWPRTDKEYPLRMEFQRRIDLPEGSSISIVDAQLIVYATAAMLSVAMGEDKQAEHYSTMYKDRMMALRGWQSAGNRFAMDTAADFGEEEFFRDDLMPNWNRGPTMAP